MQHRYEIEILKLSRYSLKKKIGSYMEHTYSLKHFGTFCSQTSLPLFYNSTHKINPVWIYRVFSPDLTASIQSVTPNGPTSCWQWHRQFWQLLHDITIKYYLKSYVGSVCDLKIRIYLLESQVTYPHCPSFPPYVVMSLFHKDNGSIGRLPLG